MPFARGNATLISIVPGAWGVGVWLGEGWGCPATTLFASAFVFV